MKDTRLVEVYNTFLQFVLNLHVYFYEIMLQKKIPMNAVAWKVSDRTAVFDRLLKYWN